MNAAADRYYDMMEDPKHDPGFATPCQRWENGTNTTRRATAYWRGATMSHPKRRLPVTDVDWAWASRSTTSGTTGWTSTSSSSMRTEDHADSVGGRAGDERHGVAARQVAQPNTPYADPVQERLRHVDHARAQRLYCPHAHARRAPNRATPFSVNVRRPTGHHGLCNQCGERLAGTRVFPEG